MGPEPKRAGASHGIPGSWRGFEAALLGARPRLIRKCRLLTRTREEAEDLASETILRALRWQSAFDGGRPIDGWLYQIAWRLHLDSRSLTTAQGRAAAPEVDASQCLDPAELYDRAHLSLELRKALEGLNPVQRRALALAALNELSVSETASALGLSRQATKSLLKRARASARRQLARAQATAE